MYKILLTPLLLITVFSGATAQSEDLFRASGDTFNASGELLTSSFILSGEVALTVGEPLADIVVAVAKGTGYILRDTAIMSMDVTTATLQLANKPLQFSGDVLQGESRQTPHPNPVIKQVTLMTADDALAIMQAVESKDGITPRVQQLLQELDMDAAQLSGSVLVREGLDRFTENSDDMVFGIKTGDMFLLVGLEELEAATRTASQN